MHKMTWRIDPLRPSQLGQKCIFGRLLEISAPLSRRTFLWTSKRSLMRSRRTFLTGLAIRLSKIATFCIDLIIRNQLPLTSSGLFNKFTFCHYCLYELNRPIMRKGLCYVEIKLFGPIYIGIYSYCCMTPCFRCSIVYMCIVTLLLVTVISITLPTKPFPKPNAFFPVHLLCG